MGEAVQEFFAGVLRVIQAASRRKWCCHRWRDLTSSSRLRRRYKLSIADRFPLRLRGRATPTLFAADSIPATLIMLDPRNLLHHPPPDKEAFP